jgi:hypothetical protein
MKFSTGVDGLTKENQYLRTLTKYLLVVIALLLGMVLLFSNKDPIIVERDSRGLEVVKKMPFSRSESDLQQAIRLMVKARFESDSVSPEMFLNSKQSILRESEQKQLKAQNMNQAVFVHTIKITKDDALVDMDRLISVGDLRSALKAKIKINFEEVEPTELNPYGLTLSLADPIQQK